MGAATPPGGATDMETESTETSTHPDLPQEQAYLDRAYECLEDMRQ
jgi:hypothetical protein